MRIRETEHTITVPAPADTVYELIADAARWPAIFTPTVHVEYLPPEPAGGQTGQTGQGPQRGAQAVQRLRIWAFAGGAVRSWVSHRTLDPVAGRIAFWQTEPAAPVAAMRGEWLVLPAGDEEDLAALMREWRDNKPYDPRSGAV